MTTESLGAAKVSLTLDTSDFIGQIAAGKTQLAQFGTDAGRAFDESSGKARGAATSLSRYISLIGKSADEAKILRAQWNGIKPEVLEPMVTQLQRIRAEEQANIEVARIHADAVVQGQARAKAAYAEIQQFSRDEQLLRERNALQRVAEAQNRATAEQRQFNAAVRQSSEYSGEYGQRVNRMRDAVAAFTSEEFKAAEAARKVGAAHQVASKEFNKYGLSAKQQTAAMRQVPMQLTDIFVSLQGGQKPMTVLIQQGGQLKDIFGGIVPAARALGGALLGLINPYTLLAAAIGGIGFLYLQAEKRESEFRKSLILTGQQGRMTAEDLQGIAIQLDKATSATSNQAASALTQIASTGRIVANQYALVAEAATAMEIATGKAMKDTISEYVEIGRDPVSAILKLNESENFLTQSVYDRIKALQDAGDIEGAAAAATEARASSQIERAAQVVESLGLVGGAWHDIKHATGEAWDEASNYFTKLDRDAKEAMGTLGRLWASFKVGGGATPFALQAALNPPTAPAGGAAAADATINSVAQRQLDALKAGNRTREERQALEEQQIVNLYKQLGVSKEDKRVQDALAASRKAYESSGKKNSNTEAESLAKATADAQLQAIKDTLAREDAALANSGKLLQAQYSARLVTTREYYAEQRRLMDEGVNAEANAIREQIAVLQSRDVKGKEAINVTKELGKLEAQLAKVLADGATARAVLTIQEEDALAKRQRALDAYTDSLKESNEALQRSVNSEIARITMSEKAADRQQKISDILAKGAKEERDLARELADNKDQALHDQKLADLRAYVEEQVRITEEGYARMDAAQADWLNGVTTGVFNWMDATANVASQVNRITTSALDSTADAFANLALTGKFEMKSLLASILSDITKFMMKQAVLQFIKAFASYYTGGNNAADAGSLGDLYSSGSSFSTGFAKGAAFPNAHASLSAYSGTVVDSPTPFYFARGAGVMGEAGAEGIFPLERGSDGKLGVKAIGAAGGGVAVNVNVTLNSDGSASTQTSTQGDQAQMLRGIGDRMGAIARDEVLRMTRPGGELWKMGVTTR